MRLRFSTASSSSFNLAVSRSNVPVRSLPHRVSPSTQHKVYTMSTQCLHKVYTRSTQGLHKVYTCTRSLARVEELSRTGLWEMKQMSEGGGGGGGGGGGY